jgi:hypothetical protein
MHLASDRRNDSNCSQDRVRGKEGRMWVQVCTSHSFFCFIQRAMRRIRSSTFVSLCRGGVADPERLPESSSRMIKKSTIRVHALSNIQ